MTLTTFCASAFNLAMSGCSARAHNGAVKTSKSPISSRFINSPRSLSVLYHTRAPAPSPLRSDIQVCLGAYPNILGVWRSFVAYSNADDTCEPEVISAHTLQCGSAIPRAAHLTREPFGRVGV